MSESKKQSELNVASSAIAALRFITPLLLSILTYNFTELTASSKEMIDSMQQMQVTVARISEKMDSYDKENIDYEIRIRDLEKRLTTLEQRQ